MTKSLIISNFYEESDNTFPLGAGYIVSSLLEEGVDVTTHFINFSNPYNDYLSLVKLLKNNEYDSIGFGFTMSGFKTRYIRTCNIINRYKKKSRLILGGHCPSSIPEYVLEKTNADAIIVGEAEQASKDVFINDRYGIIHSKPIKDLDTLPYPAWDKFNMERYIKSSEIAGILPKDIGTKVRLANMISSRGCPNKCTFCYRLSQGIRYRSISSVIEEIKELQRRYKINYISFEDENFTFSKNRLNEFRDELEKEKLNINIWCSSRVKGIDKETVDLLDDIGVKYIVFGFESANNKILKQINKNVTLEDNIKTAELMYNSDILYRMCMVWGLPDDDYQTLENNVKFIKKYNKYYEVILVMPIIPYPGCDLYDLAIKRGLLTGVDDFFNKYQGYHHLPVNFTKLDGREARLKLSHTNDELIKDFVANAKIISNRFKQYYSRYL